MARSSSTHSSGASRTPAPRTGTRRVTVRRHRGRREPAPLDLRTPSGRKTLPF
ncbi:hypothetical protein KDK95_16950 [Actinospica sp. MGRD01-02]|uniref:Uncharacterized protein n=1 Tax=Actinospica acidithermotolerans TaxID=2828514 RepID=A0A941ECL6_9ACTN|nr:hypothetical protein [Actinospica acidithermotolerans]MBR7828007.1 hypothetical protein [Actinospica acidithermotolerans]